jgi:hypothetical protein
MMSAATDAVAGPSTTTTAEKMRRNVNSFFVLLECSAAE